MKLYSHLPTIIRGALALLFIFTLAPVQAEQAADNDAIAKSHCSDAINQLRLDYAQQPMLRHILGEAGKLLRTPPPGYSLKGLPKRFRNTPGMPCGGDDTCMRANPWQADGRTPSSEQLLDSMVEYFSDWCEFLPQTDGDQDNGLLYIQGFAWFYYQNPIAKALVQGDIVIKDRPLTAVRDFLKEFSDQRGDFMWSNNSRKHIGQWLTDPRIEIEDYQKQTLEEYGSWNDFFARQITIDRNRQTIPSRPATMPLSQFPDRDYIIVSPTDCIMNPLVQVLQAQSEVREQYLENPLQYDTVLNVKGQHINLNELLGSAAEEVKQQFVGGTGLACVLMPNTYHHFHSPVNGTVIHAEVVKTGTYGYPDFPNWAPLDGNVGRPGTDFNQFRKFERGVVIIKVLYSSDPGNPEVTPNTGYVASIPVGLDSIGSVVLDKSIVPGAIVKRGYTRLGNFYYGGSLNILLFSKGLASGAVQTRLGNQIGVFNIGSTPAE